MIRKTLSAFAVVALFASPALAAHCPQDAAAIEHALEARADMAEAQKAEITALKDRGMELHEAGDHRQSEAVLAEAMRMLLLAE